jgi:hypothetical protein
MLEHFSSVLRDRCLLHRLRALVSRQHLASFIQGVCGPDVPGFSLSDRRGDLLGLVAQVRRGGLPLNKYRSGDQQGKKDRQQYRRNEPLANTELVGISHIGPPFCSGGSAALSVTDISRGTRGDIEDMVTVRRITSTGRNLLVASRL